MSSEETAINVKAMEEALSNVVVLEEIIGFLPIADMRSCRLVNSTWLDAATAKLRKVKTKIPSPTIDNVEDVRSFLELWGTDNKNEERPRPPFTRIVFEIDFDFHCEERLLNRFFQTVAPFVVELTLQISLANPLYIARNQEVNERLSYPNLTDYCVVVEPGYVPGADLIYKPLVCGILENAPNLRCINYCGFTDFDNSCKYFDYLIDTLKERNCGQKKIKTLGIFSCGIKDAHFSRIADELPELKLDTVHINSVVNGFDMEKDKDGFFRFLQVQSKSLKFLHLCNVNGCFGNFGILIMKKLETLHVEKWKPLHQVKVVPSVDYGKQFPVLKKILLNGFDNDGWVEFMPRHGSPPVASVETLELSTKVGQAVHVEHCIRTFPNLRILRISATVVSANLVYKYLPQLQELTFDTRDATNIDDIITGFSTEECAQINRFTEQMLKRLPLKFEEDDPKEEIVPFAEGPMVQRPISVLKELKVLRLKSHVEITKVSSRLVLSKMESLQILDLGYRTSMAEHFAEVIQDMEKAGKKVEYYCESVSDINDDGDQSESDSDDYDDDQSDNHDDDNIEF